MVTKKKSASKSRAKKSTKIDLESLGATKLTKRLKRLYELEKDVENKQARLDMASRDRLAAKGALQQAQEDLQKELREQREGPGELYAGVEGSVEDDKPSSNKAKKGPQRIDGDVGSAGESVEADVG